MSYYNSNTKFVVSDHARARIKQRLKLTTNSDLETDVIINEILSGLKPSYTTKNYDYYKIPNFFNVYAVVTKNKVIITVSEMSPTKIKNLF